MNPVRRHALIVVLGVALLAPVVDAEGPTKVHKIGYLSSSTCRPTNDPSDRFRQALAALGHVEGKNIVIECRPAPGQPEQHRERAEELVRLNADLLVAEGTPSALAAQRATTKTPIAFFFVADPVASGLVTSLARPGGNITGLSVAGPLVATKKLELLKEGAPRINRVAVLMDFSNQAQVAQIVEVDVAAQNLGVKLHRVDVRSPSDLDAAFTAIVRERAQSLYFYPLRLPRADVERIVAFAVTHRLPSIASLNPMYASAGILFVYGYSFAEQYQRVAVYVDKILRGAKPADLPVEQPTKFALVVNLKTAKALGLTIPPSLLARADQVIE